jgi:hypothetical protein
VSKTRNSNFLRTDICFSSKLVQIPQLICINGLPSCVMGEICLRSTQYDGYKVNCLLDMKQVEKSPKSLGVQYCIILPYKIHKSLCVSLKKYVFVPSK